MISFCVLKKKHIISFQICIFCKHTYYISSSNWHNEPIRCLLVVLVPHVEHLVHAGVDHIQLTDHHIPGLVESTLPRLRNHRQSMNREKTQYLKVLILLNIFYIPSITRGIFITRYKTLICSAV